jgi:hypothetical protein
MAIVEAILFLLAGVWQGIRQDFSLLELGILAAILLWGCPEIARAAGWERTLSKLATRRLAVCLAIFFLAIGLRLALLPVLPQPKPVVSDEFSHLLLADTLLQGRVANPTHPFWQHFESLHIIQQPYYVSNYFPGPALALAAGRLVFGNPWAGVLLLSGLFCAVLCWALQGWLPARWALLGALLAALRFSIGSYWVNGFYGGFLPAIGGALVLGAYVRLRRRPTLAQGFLFALGFSILAISRPFEGALFGIPFFVTLPFWRWRILLPACLIVGTSIAAIGAYCYRITGSPFTPAYVVSQKTYGWPLALAWERPRPMQHRHLEMAQYFNYEVSENEKVDSVFHFVEYSTMRIQEYWRFFLGPALSVPLAMIAFVWRRRRLRVVFLGLGGGCLAVFMEGSASPHYLAPASAAIVLLLVECFRHLRTTPRGVALSRVLPVTVVLVLVLRIAAQNTGLPYTQDLNYQSWCCKVQGNYRKAELSDQLNSQPGPHLVFVRAKTDPYNLFQWIYNAAEIDSASIVWARDLGTQANRKLADYYRTRKVWMVDPNVKPARLERLDSWPAP